MLCLGAAHLVCIFWLPQAEEEGKSPGHSGLGRSWAAWACGAAQLEQAAGPRARGSARLSELVPGQSAYSQPGLRGLLPPIEGCFMTLESKWHTRWRVKYPAGPRNQTSKSFSMAAAGKVSEKQAVLHCLKLAWQAHIRETGEDPPLWQLQLEDFV